MFQLPSCVDTQIAAVASQILGGETPPVRNGGQSRRAFQSYKAECDQRWGLRLPLQEVPIPGVPGRLGQQDESLLRNEAVPGLVVQR